MSLVLTPIASDNFTRANENPLSNGGKWSVDSHGDPALEVLNNLCQSTGTFVAATALYTASTPNDQYSSITLHSTFPNTSLDFSYNAVRVTDTGVSASTLPGYFFNLVGNGNWNLYSGGAGGGSAIVIASGSGLTISAGDVYVLAVVGTTLYIFQNGTQIGSVTNTTYSSGITAIVMTEETVGDIKLSNFVMGRASTGLPAIGWSPVDSRVNPNQGVIQPSGAVFYTGQTSSNPAIPPTDSRTVVPVDSRTAGPPLNSRVDPDLPL